jgi:hypothetical protein
MILFLLACAADTTTTTEPSDTAEPACYDCGCECDATYADTCWPGYRCLDGWCTGITPQTECSDTGA